MLHSYEAAKQWATSLNITELKPLRPDLAIDSANIAGITSFLLEQQQVIQHTDTVIKENPTAIDLNDLGLCATGDCTTQIDNAANELEDLQALSAWSALFAPKQALNSNNNSNPTNSINQDNPAIDSHSILFSGYNYQCRDMMLGFDNCCRATGWGKHIAGCTDHERNLGLQRQQRRCIRVGRYCAHQVAGKCTEYKKSYCCFNSMLQKIIRDSGGKRQLQLGYEAPEVANCQGLTTNQLQQIDFTILDFSEFYATLREHLPEPLADIQAKNTIEDFIRHKPKGYYL
jgi:hypothetical protein